MKLASYVAIIVVALWSLMSLVMLWAPFSLELYWLLTLTLVLVGGCIVTIALISREYSSMASYVAIIVVALWSLMSLVQLLDAPLSQSHYWLLTLTLVLVGGGIVTIALIYREYSSEKKLKKDKFID